MEEKYMCEICDKELKSAEGLESHKRDKHPVVEKKKFKITGTHKFYAISFFIILIIIWILYVAIANVNECKFADISELSIRDHSSISSHEHAELKIILDGKELQIPANIGVTNEYMKPLHTHDESGKVHIEGPCVRDFTLNDFFTIWEKKFSSECIFDNCDGEVTLTVNGKNSDEFENLIVRDGQVIIIEYTS